MSHCLFATAAGQRMGDLRSLQRMLPTAETQQPGLSASVAEPCSALFLSRLNTACVALLAEPITMPIIGSNDPEIVGKVHRSELRQMVA